MQKLSLAERLAQIDTPAPEYDPENDLGAQPASRDEHNDQATEHYVETGASAIRRKLDSVVDQRYDGARVSRTQLSQAVEQRRDYSSDSEHDDDDDDGEGSPSEQSEDEPETPPSAQSEDEDSVEKPPAAASSVSTLEDASRQPSLQSVRDANRTKGIAISHQTSIWDSLLDARIRLQKCVSASNRLPPDTTANIRSLETYSSSLKRVLEESVMLSNELFELQEHLLESNEDVEVPPRKKMRMDAESSLDTAAEVVNAQSQAAMQLQASYHSQLIPVLNKWSSKVQAVAPSVLLPSTRGAFASSANRHPKSVVELLDEMLTDQTKLLARTQSYRGKNERFRGSAEESSNEEAVDGELFDDTDFYQQLLRDVIDSRGNNVVGGDDWRVIQKNKKARKKVDTKASKGRKLRYETHEKLQNFMVPIPADKGWHEEQVDELFGSLLGKSLRIANEDSPDPSNASTPFRIF